MDENTRVKDCPHRQHQGDYIRHEGTFWWWSCRIKGTPGDYINSCDLRGNIKLCKCKDYNDWSEKEVRVAFARLEALEKHRDAVMTVMQL